MHRKKSYLILIAWFLLSWITQAYSHDASKSGWETAPFAVESCGESWCVGKKTNGDLISCRAHLATISQLDRFQTIVECPSAYVCEKSVEREAEQTGGWGAGRRVLPLIGNKHKRGIAPLSEQDLREAGWIGQLSYLTGTGPISGGCPGMCFGEAVKSNKNNTDEKHSRGDVKIPHKEIAFCLPKNIRSPQDAKVGMCGTAQECLEQPGSEMLHFIHSTINLEIRPPQKKPSGGPTGVPDSTTQGGFGSGSKLE